MCRSRRRSLFLLSSAFVLSVLAPGFAHADDTALVSLVLQPEQTTISTDHDEDKLYVMIRIEGAPSPEIDQSDARNAMNLGLVLDKSGSMAEAGKWAHALAATKGVIDRLDGRDRLSITLYDFHAQMLVGQDALKRPNALKARLDRVNPDGGTNISAGLDNNAQLVAFGDQGERLSRVILMSDGLANEGITDKRQMRNLVRELSRQGLTVSAIGLGQDYDEAMLRAIAEAGRGNYHYVESPAQVPRIFDQEVRGLLSTIGENLALNLVPADGVGAELLNDIAYDNDAFALGLVRYDEDVVLIASFDLPEHLSPGALTLGSVQLSYKDRQSGRLELMEAPVSIQVSDDTELAVATLSDQVMTERALVEIENIERQAAQWVEAGDVALAKEELVNAENHLLDFALRIGTSSPLSKVLTAKREGLALQIERYDEPAFGSVSGSVLNKATNQALFYANKGQRGFQLLQRGDTGIAVENLEAALEAVGLAIGAEPGTFDDQDEAAVRALQAQHGLVVDGIAGPATLAVLGLY